MKANKELRFNSNPINQEGQFVYQIEDFSEHLPNRHQPKIISNHLRRKQKPGLCKEKFWQEEKQFIMEMVPFHQTFELSRNRHVIHWKVVVENLKFAYGRLHSYDRVKNYYYSKRRSWSPKVSEKLQIRYLLNPSDS
ncbi:13670_t:CDS:2 [Funneliformis mosseae]|uniref:13670_t:CDS:1 n=1 Tax=Funneliformis mosseae TaxID=27381 RepID=A0A9N8V844_FUNMO|nr:13670_t:CDS:2 [Funneliformis mosseae]